MDTSSWKWLEAVRRQLAIAACAALSGSAFAVALLTGSSPAFAADEQASSGVLEEIVVTARYREEKLQETPIAITAITATELQARNITTAADVGYLVPNASFRPTQAAFGNTMSAYIRG